MSWLWGQHLLVSVSEHELVIRQLNGSREVVVTFVIESQRVRATNMAAKTYACAPCVRISW